VYVSDVFILNDKMAVVKPTQLSQLETQQGLEEQVVEYFVDALCNPHE
jgi:hypothetical protein